MEPMQWWGHGFGFMWLMPILFFVAFIFFMRCMFGRGSSGCGFRGDTSTHKENAREILDKRFAKGELTKEEYEDMKKSLEVNHLHDK